MKTLKAKHANMMPVTTSQRLRAGSTLRSYRRDLPVFLDEPEILIAGLQYPSPVKARGPSNGWVREDGRAAFRWAWKLA